MLPDFKAHFLCSLKIWTNSFQYSSWTTGLRGFLSFSKCHLTHSCDLILLHKDHCVTVCCTCTSDSLLLTSFLYLAYPLTPQLLSTNKQDIFPITFPPLASSLVTCDIFYRDNPWFLHGDSEGIRGSSWSKHYDVNSWKWSLINFWLVAFSDYCSFWTFDL